MTKAVLFDADGVLCDAIEIHFESLNDALAELGFRIERGEEEARYNGKTTKTKLQMLTQEKGLPLEAHEYVFARKQHFTMQRFGTDLQRDESKIGLIEELRRRGIKVAICSNSIRESVRVMADSIGIADLMDEMLGNEDSPNPKPAPDIYLEGARRLGLDISECVIVEDSDTGMAAAVAAGPAKVIRVRGPHEVNLQLVHELVTVDRFVERELLIADIADFLGVDKAFVEPRVNEHPNRAIEPGLVTVPNLWKWMYGHREGTADEYRFYYAVCFPYIFDLANFAEQFRAGTSGAHALMRGRVLDYGAGIGTVGFHMAQLDCVDSVDVIDVNPLLTEFMDWRRKRYGLDKVRVLRATDTPSGRREPHHALCGPYDFIYARDTLEHCIDRLDIVACMVDALADGGAICEATPIEDYDEETGKENIARRAYDIWEYLKDQGFKVVAEEFTGGFSHGTTKVWRRE